MTEPLGQQGSPDADPRESWNSALASGQPVGGLSTLKMSRDCRIPTRRKGPAGPESDFFTFGPGQVVGGRCVPLGAGGVGRMETGSAQGDNEARLFSAAKPLVALGIVVGAVMLISRGALQ